jgi:hypothetical protein
MYSEVDGNIALRAVEVAHTRVALLASVEGVAGPILGVAAATLPQAHEVDVGAAIAAGDTRNQCFLQLYADSEQLEGQKHVGHGDEGQKRRVQRFLQVGQQNRGHHHVGRSN